MDPLICLPDWATMTAQVEPLRSEITQLHSDASWAMYHSGVSQVFTKKVNGSVITVAVDVQTPFLPGTNCHALQPDQNPTGSSLT
jgi:hypothetical protein